MNQKTAMKLFGLLGLLMLLSCGYADRHRNNSSCEQVLVRFSGGSCTGFFVFQCALFPLTGA